MSGGTSLGGRDPVTCVFYKILGLGLLGFCGSLLDCDLSF